MFGTKRNKESERYYLLPGQGGPAYRRKRKQNIRWAIFVGLLMAMFFALLLYLLNRPQL